MSEYCPKCGEKTSEDDSRLCANCQAESELAALNGSPCVVCGSPLTLGVERAVPVLMVHCNTCGSEVPWHVTQKLNLYKARGKTAASMENDQAQAQLPTEAPERKETEL